ncbi:MAG: LacI family DNA-binding transcriptional regulator [Sediminibacterium sp.]|nr:LacI family DNA-binding transcriptional regulator [Sediminibacterium sp.]
MKKFEAVTIKDIAKKLKLATSTVSRALNYSYQISSETKEKVLSLAKEMNYSPNPNALGLREKNTKSVGIIVSEIANSFFSQAINGIESIAQEKGYNVVITQSKEFLEHEISAINYLSSRQIGGIIISVSTETSNFKHIQELNSKGLPIVSFDRVVDFKGIHKVKLNNFEATYKATEHLLNNGYKNISLIVSAQHLSITEERKQGYFAALNKFNLEKDNQSIYHCNYGGVVYDEVENILKKMLKIKKKPDAILTCSDKITTNVLRFCYKNKIKIPTNLGLIGFSNLDLTEFLTPPISIIKQPAFEMGKISCELLLKQIESKRPISVFEEIKLSAEHLFRQSSRKINF